MYHLKRNSKTIMYYDAGETQETLPESLMTIDWRSSSSLGRCSSQLRESYVGANIEYLREERVFILEHYFASESVAAIREAFTKAYPGKEVRNKTAIQRQVKTFRDTGSVCLWQMLFELQSSWNMVVPFSSKASAATMWHSCKNSVRPLGLSSYT
jgi:hypothetical protein